MYYEICAVVSQLKKNKSNHESISFDDDLVLRIIVTRSKYLKKKSYIVLLQARNGRVTLYDGKVSKLNEDTKISLTMELMHALAQWRAGYIKCLKCGRYLMYGRFVKHYFSSYYCNNCWQEKLYELN